MPELRRSSRKRKLNKAFSPESKVRQRDTGKRILKHNKKEIKEHIPHGNTLGEREIRTAARERAAPLIVRVNEQQMEVCLYLF